MKLDPDDIVAEALSHHTIVARFCLFSGGSDSSVVAHRARDHYTELVHIDTGTALPGVQDFCRDYADWLGKPLRILTTPADEYRRLVLGSDRPRLNGKPDLALGFPGPANHGICYTRLKQRRIEALMRDSKRRMSRERILLITGLRRGESKRRSKRKPVNWTSKNAGVWCNPLIDWTNAEMHDYREAHSIPRSDIAALLHRSGECNCGAFAAPGERAELQALFPEWWAQTMGPLEEAAQEVGLVNNRWGAGKGLRQPASQPLCSDCEVRAA